MTLFLKNRYIWDFWFAKDKADYHLFYLQASRSLPDPDQRHWNVSIGHAVSQDLVKWQVLPDALKPGPAGTWDDYTTWTGSVIRHEDKWYLFYTGTCHADKGLVQKIGLATSPDLISWEKHPANPLIVADPQFYEELDLKLWHDQAWRDPFVFRDPTTGEFHAYITARVNYGPADGRGVIAHARSKDLLDWEVLPPVTGPGDFGQMEVPELVQINGRYYLIFCSSTELSSKIRKERTGQFEPIIGTHYLVSENMLGPFRYTTDDFLVGDKTGSLYAGKLIQAPDGEWMFMAWLNTDSEGKFWGALSDPTPVSVDEKGNLEVTTTTIRGRLGLEGVS